MHQLHHKIFTTYETRHAPNVGLIDTKPRHVENGGLQAGRLPPATPRSLTGADVRTLPKPRAASTMCVATSYMYHRESDRICCFHPTPTPTPATPPPSASQLVTAPSSYHLTPRITSHLVSRHTTTSPQSTPHSSSAFSWRKAAPPFALPFFAPPRTGAPASSPSSW